MLNGRTVSDADVQGRARADARHVDGLYMSLQSLESCNLLIPDNPVARSARRRAGSTRSPIHA